jgi:hypothetical protein
MGFSIYFGKKYKLLDFDDDDDVHDGDLDDDDGFYVPFPYYTAIYAIIVALWGTIFLRHWARKEALFAVKWGMG